MIIYFCDWVESELNRIEKYEDFRAHTHIYCACLYLTCAFRRNFSQQGSRVPSWNGRINAAFCEARVVRDVCCRGYFSTYSCERVAHVKDCWGVWLPQSTYLTAHRPVRFRNLRAARFSSARNNFAWIMRVWGPTLGRTRVTRASLRSRHANSYSSIRRNRTRKLLLISSFARIANIFTLSGWLKSDTRVNILHPGVFISPASKNIALDFILQFLWFQRVRVCTRPRNFPSDSTEDLNILWFRERIDTSSTRAYNNNKPDADASFC